MVVYYPIRNILKMSRQGHDACLLFRRILFALLLLTIKSPFLLSPSPFSPPSPPHLSSTSSFSSLFLISVAIYFELSDLLPSFLPVSCWSIDHIVEVESDF